MYAPWMKLEGETRREEKQNGKEERNKEKQKQKQKQTKKKKRSRTLATSCRLRGMAWRLPLEPCHGVGQRKVVELRWSRIAASANGT
jgi:hypothetical protein